MGPRSGRGWRTRNDPLRGRRSALRAEVGYWEDWVARRGGKWADEYKSRFDPAAEVWDPALREVLREIPHDDVSILDVGAGPASTVGCRFPGKLLSIVAIDPLADSYTRVLAQAGVVPPVRTERLEGERLVERFGRERFDIAYARNALDHAIDPTVIIEQMLDVVSVGGYVVLRHVRNEAVRQAYGQLHQWNFEERDGQLIVWRVGHQTAVGDLLDGRGEMTCRTGPTDETGAASVVCIVRKTAAA